MELKKALGKNIRKFRKLHNITQEKLAEIIGIEVNSISSIETGKYFPSSENLVKISNALKISLSDLFNIKEEYTTESCFREIIGYLDLIKSDKTKLLAVNSFIKNIL